MTPPIKWHTEFAKIITCANCTRSTCRHILRNRDENIPQPGYIGARYVESLVLLVGQNPGTPKSLEVQDRPYTASLRALRDTPTPQRYAELSAVLKHFIPQWPVTNKYFPLSECKLSLEDISYCNVIRCRTDSDRKPNQLLAQECIKEHFVNWLHMLSPNVVIFIGKWAWEQGHNAVDELGIPCLYMNRQRNLPADKRAANRNEVAALVRKYRG